jgi:hypothetical protein
VLDAAHPCDAAFYSHAKAAMRNAAEAAKVQVPFALKKGQGLADLLPNERD